MASRARRVRPLGEDGEGSLQNILAVLASQHRGSIGSLCRRVIDQGMQLLDDG